MSIGVLFPIWWFYNLRAVKIRSRCSPEEVNAVIDFVKRVTDEVIPGSRVCVPEAALKGEYAWVPEILVVYEKELTPSLRAEVMSRILFELRHERPFVTIHLTDNYGAKRYEVSVGKLVCK